MRGGARQQGFTLIEMLAAFVVFALGFAVMMDVASSGMRNARRAAEQTEAALWAQSLMDAAGIDAKIEPGASSGKFDRKYRWDMQVSDWEPPADAARASLRLSNTITAPSGHCSTATRCGCLRSRNTLSGFRSSRAGM